MKVIVKLIFVACLLAIPAVCKCDTFAFSPSRPGMPLIFHFSASQLAPFQYSAVTWTQLQNALLIRSSYTHHLDNLSNRKCCGKLNFWADAMGEWIDQDPGHQQQFGYNDFTGGITLGAGTCYRDFVVGVAASYTKSTLNWKQSAGDCEINSYYGGLYTRWNKGRYYVNAALLGAFNDYQTSRHLYFRTLDRHAEARHDGGEVLAGIEAGVMLQRSFYNMDLIPFVSLDYVYLSQGDFNEDGARGLNLHIKSRNDQLLQSELGLQFTSQARRFSESWAVVPNLSVSYINQTPLTGRSYYNTFVGRSRVFSVEGLNFEHNLGGIGFDLNFLSRTQALNITLYYDGQFGKNYWKQTGSIMCNLCF